MEKEIPAKESGFCKAVLGLQDYKLYICLAFDNRSNWESLYLTVENNDNYVPIKDFTFVNAD